MAFIKWLHDLSFAGSYAHLFPTPLALGTLILFLWSLIPAVTARVGRPFVYFLHFVWALFLIPAVTGIILAVGGDRVASAVAAPGQTLTKYGFVPDPVRNYEHWMYAVLSLAALYTIETVVRGRLIKPSVGLRLLPVATLFLYGVAYMVGRVAVLPGIR